MMGVAYGVLFSLMGLLLMHPTIGLSNIEAHPHRFLGWLSYVTIESFGSMVVQCYWALVNSSVDVKFAKKNFGLIVAGAQIGSILGPTVATQADSIGITPLYLLGSAIMFMMVAAMYFYVEKFGVPGEEADKKTSGEVKKKDSGKSAEGEMAIMAFLVVTQCLICSSLFCFPRVAFALQARASWRASTCSGSTTTSRASSACRACTWCRSPSSTT